MLPYDLDAGSHPSCLPNANAVQCHAHSGDDSKDRSAVKTSSSSSIADLQDIVGLSDATSVAGSS